MANKIKTARKRTWAALIVVTVAAVGWFHYSGYRTFHDLSAIWNQELELETQVEELKRRNAALEDEIKDLAPGGPGIEKRAREDLGWSRPDEIVIRIPEKQ